jgi:hypothetical protein
VKSRIICKIVVETIKVVLLLFGCVLGWAARMPITLPTFIMLCLPAFRSIPSLMSQQCAQILPCQTSCLSCLTGFQPRPYQPGIHLAKSSHSPPRLATQGWIGAVTRIQHSFPINKPFCKLRTLPKIRIAPFNNGSFRGGPSCTGMPCGIRIYIRATGLLAWSIQTRHGACVSGYADVTGATWRQLDRWMRVWIGVRG